MKEFKGTNKQLHYVDYAGQFVIQDGPMYEDCNVLNYDDCVIKAVTKQEAEANARLFCAASKMLHVLQDIVFNLKQLPPAHIIDTAIEEAEKSINKALGNED